MVVIRPIESKVMDGGGWLADTTSWLPSSLLWSSLWWDAGRIFARPRPVIALGESPWKEKQNIKTEISRSQQPNKFPEVWWLFSECIFPRKRGPAPVVIERLENFHFFSKLFLYAMHGYKNSHVCFLFFFFYLILFGRVWRRRRYSRARPLNQVFSLWCNFFSNLKTKKFVVHRVNQFSFLC